MNILITGATGFLGYNLLKSKLSEGNTFVVFHRKTSNLKNIENLNNNRIIYFSEENDLDDLFKSQNFDLVIHCATNYGYDQNEISEILSSNLFLPLKLIEFCKIYNVKYFINTDTLINKRVNFYSESKSQLNFWLSHYSKFVNIINIKLDHFFGPGDNSSKFIISIIHKLISGVAEIKLTKGEQKRRFLYIDDVVFAFILIIENLNKFNNYEDVEVTGNKLFTIKHIVETAKLITKNNKTKLRWGALKYRTNEVFEPKSNLTKIHNLGWKQQFEVENSLIKTINYYNQT